MKIEDIKNEYPSIPDGIHEMVEAETKKQIDLARNRKVKERPYRSSRKTWSAWKIAAVVVLGILATGTVAYAGTKIYQLRLEQQGNYGLDVEVVDEEKAEESTTAEVSTQDQPDEQPKEETVRAIPEEMEGTNFVFGYIPEGMEQSSPYQLSSRDGRAVLAIGYLYDEGDPDQLMHLTDILESEVFESRAQAAVYTKVAGGGYNQRLYLFFPDQLKIVTMMVNGLSKEDAIRVASELSLEGNGETVRTEGMRTWNDMIREMEKVRAYDSPTYLDAMATQYALMPEGKIHTVGESFSMVTSVIVDDEWVDTDELFYCVDKVKICSDVAVLDPDYIRDDRPIADFIDEDGSLLPAELHFFTRGDGINTTQEEVFETTVDTKLLYVTMTLTNTGDVDLENVPVYGTVRLYLQTNGFDQIDGNSLTEEAGVYLNGITYNCGDLFQGDFGFVRTQFDKPWGQQCTMQYYDFSSTAVGDGGNYVPLIPAGESVTVHLGYLVSEDMLPYMYLDLGSWEYQLQNGIDIRQ
ncbi:MAG: hypothetical protein IJM83_01020 [Firmicutes bacterium]|nr:hypothetical protein [Bacillota bacterium]